MSETGEDTTMARHSACEVERKLTDAELAILEIKDKLSTLEMSVQERVTRALAHLATARERVAGGGS
jgi:hypothetical protein